MPAIGHSLAEVLSDLQAEGLQIVFSTAVVTPTMVVEAEPSANDPRRILDQILAPHGLTAEEGPGGTVIIVVATPVGEGSPVAGEIHGLETVSGNPIEAPDMMIVIEDTPIEVAPAPDGSFVIPDLPAGRYTVTVTSTSSMLWVMNADEVTDHGGRSGRSRTRRFCPRHSGRGGRPDHRGRVRGRVSGKTAPRLPGELRPPSRHPSLRLGRAGRGDRPAQRSLALVRFLLDGPRHGL